MRNKELMSMRILLCIFLVRRIDGSEGLQSLEVLGVLELESSGVNYEKVKAGCYSGIQLYPKCKMRKTRNQGYAFTKTEAWNEVDGESNIICLECCSNLYYNVGERIDEVWDLECEVTEPIYAKHFYGYEFQFARNKDADDTGVIRCAIGRMGCKYQTPDNEFYLNERPLSCTSNRNDNDFGACESLSEKAVCSCQIPGSQKGGTRPDANGNYDSNFDGIRQLAVTGSQACGSRQVQSNENNTEWFLKGYTLTIDIEEKSNSQGDYWRSVTGCQVDTLEVLDFEVGDTFYERIRMRGPKRHTPYRWWSIEHGLLFIIFGSILCIFLSLYAIRYIRNTPCPTCGALLIWSKSQCTLCRYYEVPMPDPLILARLKARSHAVRGKGSVVLGHTPKSNDNRSSICCPSQIIGQHTCTRLSQAFRLCLHALFEVCTRLHRCLVSILLKLFPLSCFLEPSSRQATTITKKFNKVVNESSSPRVHPLVYLADPKLRTENIFDKMTRRVGSHEHEIVVQGHLQGNRISYLDHEEQIREEKRQAIAAAKNAEEGNNDDDDDKNIPELERDPVLFEADSTFSSENQSSSEQTKGSSSINSEANKELTSAGNTAKHPSSSDPREQSLPRRSSKDRANNTPPS